MIEDAIFARLSGFTALTDLIGTRIHALVMPQGETKPAVVYQRISAVPTSAMGSDTGDSTARIQITSYGAGYVSARAVATQVRKALQRYRATIGGVEIKASFVENDLDDYDPETEEYRVVQDFRIHFMEA